MTDAELTILSILAQGPRFGHEIQQIIDERGLREWMAIGFSSIYYMLNKFERQKMVESELRPDGAGSPRKLYSLAEAGQGILQTSISDLLRAPRSLGTGFELGLANLYVLKPAQVFQVLSHHREDLITQLEAVKGLWDKHLQSKDIENRHDLRALYTHSISRMEADLRWLTDFLEDWKERYPSVEKEDLPHIHRDKSDVNVGDTDLHRNETPDAMKMIQRLQRPNIPKKDDESEV
jgi:DNA-binding PadR family transcriptional regulator